MAEMDMVKAHFSAILSSVRDHQEQLGQIALSLEAAIEAMKTLNPEFANEYDMQLLSPDRDSTRKATQRVLGLIDTAIQTVENWKQAR